MKKMALVFLLVGVTGCSTNNSASEVQSSENPAAKIEEISIEGTLFGAVAIGGETTGFGLKTVGGKSIELDLLTNHFESSFAEGKQVKITGKFTTVLGVEIPSRQVFTVSSIADVELYAKGTIVDYRGLDGCTFLVRLDDGTRLEADIPAGLQIDGLRVELSYVSEPRMSICMVGETVSLISIAPLK
jgi:hypothetical protein